MSPTTIDTICPFFGSCDFPTEAPPRGPDRGAGPATSPWPANDPPSFFRRALTLSPMLFCEWGRCDPWAEGSGRVHAATAFLRVSKKMRSEPTLKKTHGF